MRGAGALDRTLAALADPVRREAVEVLSTGPAAAGDLARRLGVGAPQMSRHLRALRTAGLVEEARDPVDARLRVYALRGAPIRELRGWLEDAERLWVDQLDALRRHLEDAPAGSEAGGRSQAAGPPATGRRERR